MWNERLGCVAHLDVDAFFASVEQRDDPQLRGRPVAVGTGVVASCSYEARPHGVRTGMRLTEARKRCPRLVVLPGDYRRYELAGRRILGICQQEAPRIETAALDDLYFDLSPLSLARAADLGQKLHRLIADEVGLRTSLGVGVNKLVAAVATQEVKERKARGEQANLLVVPAGTERTYLADWPVEVLPGIGSRTAEELARLNVRRVRELAEAPLAVLVRLFGPRGKVFREMALGRDQRAVRPDQPAQSVSRCTSFEPAVSEMPFLLAMLDHLLERALLWMRTHDRAARGLTLRLRYADHQAVDGRVSLSAPSDEESELKPVAREKLARLYTRRLPLRYLGVELSPLGPRDRQADLFPDAQKERDKRLRGCKDEIRRRFGFLAVTNGTALELKEKLEHDRDNFRLRTPCLTR